MSTEPELAHPDSFPFGYPDHIKFRSCPTLYMNAPAGDRLLNDTLLKYLHGKPDQLSLDLLTQQQS